MFQIYALMLLMIGEKKGNEMNTENITEIWVSTTLCYTKYVTNERYKKFRPETQRWYEPYQSQEVKSLSSRIAELEQQLADLQAKIDGGVK